MFNFLHSHIPNSIFFSFGPFTFYFYGLFLLIAIFSGILLTLKLSPKFEIKKEDLIDLSIYLIIFGIIGARIYEIFLEFPYYYKNPFSIFKIWEGGLAIHGAILSGLFTIYFFSKKRQLNTLKLTALIALALPLGQAIGRWGNWFNQELFGLPSKLPWSIPISILNRPANFIDFEYFHPTFFYESLGSFFIFIILLLFVYRRDFISGNRSKLIISFYLISYSLLRFLLEFIKIDETPYFLVLRWPQIFSLLIIVFAIFYLYRTRRK